MFPSTIDNIFRHIGRLKIFTGAICKLYVRKQKVRERRESSIVKEKMKIEGETEKNYATVSQNRHRQCLKRKVKNSATTTPGTSA